MRENLTRTQSWVWMGWLQLVSGAYMGREGSATPLLDQHIESVTLVIDFLSYLALFVLL